MNKPSHKQIVKILAREIYEEKLKPGDKLEPLRELSKKLGADQTSLRIALKHLEFLNLLEIKRSDGVYVLDYKKNTGPDFLNLLLPENSKLSSSSDNILLVDEFFEFWIIISPELIRLSWKKYGIKNVREMLKIYDLELKSLENLEVLIQSELRLIDMLTEVSDNLVLTLMMNSIRPLQTKMIEYFIKGIGIKEFKSYILQRKKMISGILANNPDDQKVNIQRYKVLMEKYRDILKAKLAKSI